MTVVASSILRAVFGSEGPSHPPAAVSSLAPPPPPDSPWRAEVGPGWTLSVPPPWERRDVDGNVDFDSSASDPSNPILARLISIAVPPRATLADARTIAERRVTRTGRVVAQREVVVHDIAQGTKERLGFDVFHAVPPQSAPDWVRQGPLADTSTPAGYIALDKHTLRHVVYANIFGLGDAGSTPNSKTGAAVRHQAPVLVKNLQDAMAGRDLSASYDGYASCPLTTARDRMLLAEFDYSMTPAPSIPLLNTKREHRDFGLLKKVGLPTLYWNLMLTGRA